MTPTGLLICVIIAYLLWQVFQKQTKRFSCKYCGCYKGHDVHCPYNHDLLR